MKKNVLFVVKCLMLVMIVIFVGGCKGGDGLTGPDTGQTTFTFDGATVRVTNAYEDGKLYNLSCNGVKTESMPDSMFNRYVLTGDPFNWQQTSGNTVPYGGGPDVAVSGMKSGFKLNGYFLSPDGRTACWHDLGQAQCVGGGCTIVEEKQYDRHYVLLNR